MAGGPTTSPPKHKPRHLAKLSNNDVIGRWRMTAQFQRKVTELAATAKFPRLAAFLPQNFLPWVWNYLKSVFRGKYKPFPVYLPPAPGSPEKPGVYRLQAADGGNVIRIAMAGDWGTGTLESQSVASSMQAAKPDYTIHLGDVYYVGEASEIEENCLGQARHGYTGVRWPHGSLGSFALNGNHEMYAGGKAYFTVFLPTLGLRNPRHKQLTSFFCLETPCWRILAIDTGYNSVGLPILGAIPWINKLSWVGADCRLEAGLLDWLRNVVDPKSNRKPTLLLSHHQYYTAFKDESYTVPAKQMQEFFPQQEMVWIWGHEHRMGIYDKFALAAGGGLRAYGRCVGHGGVPVDVGDRSKFDTAKAPLTFFDSSTHQLSDGTPVGRNGFVLLTLNDYDLTLDYRDLDNQPMFREKFVGQCDGTITYSYDPPPPGGLTKV